MKIEKIEFIGFKSFADRTVVTLHPGVNCIVGPNGCGKSNVVDAFKWVLGEQSAKSLRGDKMEEVIFQGSTVKKPKGMAEVTLHVSGLGAEGNGDEKRLTSVSRRLFRSGDSEYMLNRRTCRLKDIRDLFLDTGLEVKSYSILEQEKISAILNAKPEDRRFLIEEVAGVVKYKVRRHEAKLKLESSRANLQRINDIVSEVRRQISSLDRQAKRAERYKKLMEELKDLELRLASRDWAAFKSSLASATEESEALADQDAFLRGQTSKMEANLESRRLYMVEKEKALESALNELQSAERAVAETERAMAVLKSERDGLSDSIARLDSEKEEVLAKRAESERKALDIESGREGLASEIQALDEAVKTETSALDEKGRGLRIKEELLDAKRREGLSASEDLSRLRNELAMLGNLLENNAKRRGVIEAERDETETALKDTEGRIAELIGASVAKQNELKLIREEREGIAAEISELKDRAEELRSAILSAREDLASAGSRMESLSDLYITADRTLEITPVARISEIMDVPGEYEKAVEAALREAVDGLVLSGAEDVIATVKAIKEKEAERTALVSKEAKTGADLRPVPPGALGRASDKVKAAPGYEGLVSALLGDVAIVNDLRSALAISGQGMRLVTLDGEVVEPSGLVTAGKGKDLLRVKRQIKELEAELDAKKRKIESLESFIEETLGLIARKEERLAEAGERLSLAERDVQAIRHRDETMKDELERGRRKLAALRLQIEETGREESDIKKSVSEKNEGIDKAGMKKLRIESEAEELAGVIAKEKELFESLRARTVDTRLKLGSLRERAEATEKELKAVRSLHAELGDKVSYIEREKENSREKIGAKEREHAVKEESLRGLVIKADSFKRDAAALRAEMSETGLLVRNMEQELKNLRQRLDPVMKRMQELELGMKEISLRMEGLSEKIKTNYDMDIDGLSAGPTEEGDEEKAEEMRKKVREIGPVSLESIEEYGRLKERHDFLTGQQSDIEKSIAELEEAITKINATTRKKLRDAYEALKVKFVEIFTLLFAGGRAELRLTDESNILETGIDIVAQPPGKKLQNINLLSGGEKTLTALSLLFASFLIKPTPLCILDEADGALDDSNTLKFANMLKELSKGVQFIVITHNRVTMEAADYIYGITMEEPGSSKVVSMQLVEAAGAAEAGTQAA